MKRHNDKRHRDQVKYQKHGTHGKDAIGMNVVNQAKNVLCQRRIEGSNMWMVDPFHEGESGIVVPFQFMEQGQLLLIALIVKRPERFGVVDFKHFIVVDFFGRIFKRVDSVSKYLAVPQITINIIFLNLL